MEIPYEIKKILLNTYTNNTIPSTSKNNYSEYIILEPSLYQYFTQDEKFVIMSLINELGHLSNLDRHISTPVTSFSSFINNNNNFNKKIVLKCINDLIIGFIYLKQGPILIRNEYNLNYFYKNLIIISDFYIMRNYRRMNYGKELFDKIIYMTNIKPVLMAYEFPNKPLMNFLGKNYGITNPINQLNNIITFYNYKDENFNKYLDDYHRAIDVNKMEDDIDNYRKWSPLNNDFNKRFNSDYTYKNIFPLQFQNKNQIKNKLNRSNIISNSRYDNIENNFINNYNKKNYNNNNNSERLDEIKHKKNNIYNNINIFNRSNSNIGRNNNNIQINAYEKKYNTGKSTPIPLAIKEIISNRMKEPNKKYFHKFNDYYLNQLKNNKNIYSINKNQHDFPNNSVRENYFNFINDENRYIQKKINNQKEREKRLNKSIIRLTDKIKEGEYRTPIRNNNEGEFYYRKNRSFATIFDSIENNKTEENDFHDYEKFKKYNEFID